MTSADVTAHVIIKNASYEATRHRDTLATLRDAQASLSLKGPGRWFAIEDLSRAYLREEKAKARVAWDISRAYQAERQAVAS